ncbi:hypothetical protein BMS3Bbin10_00069 [bacterium BMS3Bbin10]|nr:hypothetical protein BMS3Bbin10_00069 [bacterium BMS3Bbin10]
MKRLIVLFVLVTITAVRGAGAEPAHLRLYAAEGEFEDVKLFVEDAIISQGLTIDFRGHVGQMLERTRAAVGGSKIYKRAEFFLFCSAVISRATMEADPSNISFCPYNIFYYELETEPGKIHVGYRRPAIVGSEASKKSLAAVDDLLDKIVREATE